MTLQSFIVRKYFRQLVRLSSVNSVIRGFFGDWSAWGWEDWGCWGWVGTGLGRLLWVFISIGYLFTGCQLLSIRERVPSADQAQVRENEMFYPFIFFNDEIITPKLIKKFKKNIAYILVMIQKKNFIMSIKNALKSGTFNYIGQQLKEFPEQIWKIDQLKLDDQNWWECNPISKIDVSNNQIAVIPQDIALMADLQVLRIRNNLVNQLPRCLAAFPILKSLDFSRNRVVLVPEDIANAKALVQINLAENLLEYCPNLDRIKTLQVVFLNNNKLKRIPNLGQNIKKAQFQQNQIPQITRQNFQKCSCLQTLNLSKNQISQIQQNSFSNCKNLIMLQLKQNRLQKFNELPNSQKLDTISLSFNRLTEFTYFDRCPNLTVLVLSDNKIRNISKDIIKLKKLKTLDLANNDLSDLPCQIGFIGTLVRIQVQGNPLKTMRQNIRTGGTNVIKKYLQDKMDPKQKELIEKSIGSSFEKVSDGQYWSKLLYQFTQSGQLILRKMNLTSLDEQVYQKNLKGINISQNKISSLSQSIYKLDQLKYLILNNNQFLQLPNSLQRLPILQQIQAKNNQISQFIVTSPYGYPKLSYLDLSANRLKYIPKGILTLPKLRTLHLSYNNITDIQGLLGEPRLLPFLEVLDVSNNRITDISDMVYFRVSLNYFNVENNSLTKIPTVLGFMKLSGLKIDGNPLKLIKRTVIDKGTVAIMEYLRTKHTGELPAIPDNIIPQQKQQFVLKPQKPNYPYQTQHKLVKNTQQQPTQQQQPSSQQSQPQPQQQQQQQQQQKQKQLKQLQQQIKNIQQELDTNMGMNTMMKNNKKKLMQSLMIERNKIIKGDY